MEAKDPHGTTTPEPGAQGGGHETEPTAPGADQSRGGAIGQSRPRGIGQRDDIDRGRHRSCVVRLERADREPRELGDPVSATDAWGQDDVADEVVMAAHPTQMGRGQALTTVS